MSETEEIKPEQAEQAEPVEHQADEHSQHPSDWQYIKVAIFLAVLTAIEVFTYFESVHRLNNAAIFAVLIVIMILKFFYVAAWFMHLKFDSPLMRNIFLMGMGFALLVYLAMLTSFRIWA